ncbi:hypothetical protein HaLaN_19380 [Haematococcus lacustris]|uniref:Uncharacterized protein n=1 Tax=Haematococcus lacustris TaxID=44745 RepID=A0A699ZTI0_HAELA|nr:hypothetical protein HaLaN_19380 [Haematococcus lacustris]
MEAAALPSLASADALLLAFCPGSSPAGEPAAVAEQAALGLPPAKCPALAHANGGPAHPGLTVLSDTEMAAGAGPARAGAAGAGAAGAGAAGPGASSAPETTSKTSAPVAVGTQVLPSGLLVKAENYKSPGFLDSELFPLTPRSAQAYEALAAEFDRLAQLSNQAGQTRQAAARPPGQVPENQAEFISLPSYPHSLSGRGPAGGMVPTSQSRGGMQLLSPSDLLTSNGLEAVCLGVPAAAAAVRCSSPARG